MYMINPQSSENALLSRNDKQVRGHLGISWYRFSVRLIMNESSKAGAKGVSAVIMIRTHESAIGGVTGHKQANFERSADGPRKCLSN